MEFAEVLRRRRIVRRYTSEPVQPDVLARVLAATRWAPTAGNSQGQSFVVVTRADSRASLAALAGEEDWVARGYGPWVSSAPALVVPCCEPSRYRQRYSEADKASSRGPDAWAVPFWWVDGGAALMALLLAAVNEGLAAGFLDIAERDGLRRLLGIPADVEPLGLVTLGHAAADRRSRSLDRPVRHDAVHREHWGRHA